jgi:hypothetical protein
MAYEHVNDQWPDELPTPTGDEAIAACKRLYRFGLKKSWRGKWKLTSGRRYTWPRGSTFYVNPNGEHFGGWRDLVHFMSHYCFSQLMPHRRPHDSRHEYLEREMVRYVIEQGWLEGKLRRKAKAEPTIDEINAAKLAHIEAAIRRWETKAKRAATALRKLQKKKARMNRA